MRPDPAPAAPPRSPIEGLPDEAIQALALDFARIARQGALTPCAALILSGIAPFDAMPIAPYQTLG